MFASNALIAVILENGLDKTQTKFGTDKGSTHTYAQNLYPNIFNLLNRVDSILEIGVWKGASCALWKLVFPGAKVVGVDISISELHPLAKKMLVEGEISILQADAYSQSFFNTQKGRYDLVIDDGPHTVSSQIEALKFRKILSSHGILVIEDIQSGALDFYKIRKSLPREERKKILFLSFVNVSFRYDDAVVIYCQDSESIKILKEYGKSFRYWGMMSPILHFPYRFWARFQNRIGIRKSI